MSIFSIQRRFDCGDNTHGKEAPYVKLVRLPDWTRTRGAPSRSHLATPVRCEIGVVSPAQTPTPSR